MIQFMGHENLEDYNADFLCMLETWEAGAQFFLPLDGGKRGQAINSARLWGWTRFRCGPMWSAPAQGHNLDHRWGKKPAVPSQALTVFADCLNEKHISW